MCITAARICIPHPHELPSLADKIVRLASDHFTTWPLPRACLQSLHEAASARLDTHTYIHIYAQMSLTDREMPFEMEL